MGIQVAHLGLGKMGRGIAGNIRGSGFDLTVWNRSRAAADDFIAEGGSAAATPAAAVAGAAVVVSSLFDDASLFDVLTGSDGALAGMTPGTVRQRSNSPSTARCSAPWS